MSTVLTDISSHAEETNLSYQNLCKSREAAQQESEYSSEAMRELLTKACLERCNHQAPYPWQLEAFILGLDCTILAGTGSGKTLPFLMPAMVLQEKMLVVLSPLNSLEDDQVARCRRMGITAIAFNNQTNSELLRLDIEKMKYQVVYTSPEMVITNSYLNSFLCSSECHDRLLGVVVDEAHCIVQWGKDFRPTYGKLDKLRSFIPTRVPIYATSATLTPDVLLEIRRILHISTSKSFHLNLGNDRPNIYQEISTIPNATHYSAFDFLFDGVEQVEDLPRALIFVNRVVDSQYGWQHWHQQLPPYLRHCVGFLNARRSERAKSRELERFKTGELRVLWVTEIGGMGLDIPDITFVGQLGVPQSLTVWIQRAGRAGRSPNIEARALMCVEASVLQKVACSGLREPEKGSELGSDDERDDEREGKLRYRKKIEPTLREFVETRTCRRDVADKLFNNPARRLVAHTRCCDNCTRASKDTRVTPSATTAFVDDHEIDTNPSNSTGRDPTDLPAPRPRSTTSRRSQQHLHDVRRALQEWRVQIRRQDFPHSTKWTVAEVLVIRPIARDAFLHVRRLIRQHARSALSGLPVAR